MTPIAREMLEGALAKLQNGGAERFSTLVCDVGPWCLRCLIADAKGEIDKRDGVLYDDEMFESRAHLRHAARALGIDDCTQSRRDSEAVLRYALTWEAADA